MSGDLLQIELSNKDTVHVLKNTIANEENQAININQVKLVDSITGDELSDNNRTLESCGLIDGHLLYMAINTHEPPFMNQKYIVLKECGLKQARVSRKF
jgi:Ubiquitin family